MDQNERQAKIDKLYELMELDVMRNSEEIREFLGKLYSNTYQGEDGKALIDLVYPKVMTRQEIPDELIAKMDDGSQENMQDKIRQAIDFIGKYKRGELTITQEETHENAEDNQL